MYIYMFKANIYICIENLIKKKNSNQFVAYFLFNFNLTNFKFSKRNKRSFLRPLSINQV